MIAEFAKHPDHWSGLWLPQPKEEIGNQHGGEQAEAAQDQPGPQGCLGTSWRLVDLQAVAIVVAARRG